MTEFLLFTIYAPLSSWGDITMGETRSSWDRPGRSAVLGFLGAALGLVREDREAHERLDSGLAIAVRLDAAGMVLSDYHTAQTVSASTMKQQGALSRYEVLGTKDRETILSRRAYRQDALVTVAIWTRAESGWTLPQLASALHRPAFVLYAGRKANVLGLPVDAEIVSAATLAAALEMRTMARASQAGFTPDRLALAAQPEVAYDADTAIPTGLQGSRREVRRDASPDRERWQFSDRTVEIAVLGGVSSQVHK